MDKDSRITDKFISISPGQKIVSQDVDKVLIGEGHDSLVLPCGFLKYSVGDVSAKSVHPTVCSELLGIL